MNVRNNTLINMNNLGIISNEGEMEWKSPFGQYIFKIKRYEPNPSIGMTNYRIEVNIINNLNVFITKLVFNELDCVRILDSMNWLLNDTDYQSYSNIYIGTSTEPNLDYKIIFLQIVPLASDDVYLDDNTLNPIYYNDKYDDVRDIEFKIYNYNPMQEMQVPILSFNVSYGELEDLIFALYFSCLIDIEIPNEYDNKLCDVLDGVIYR